MALIFHLDLDSFFVSAERLRDPGLIGRPVAVGGRGPRSVISSASYEARKFGVRSAMPTSMALRCCPRLIIRSPDMAYYSSLSRKVFGIVERYTPLHEAVSIDEAYLEMTGSHALFGEPRACAEKLRGEIRAETGLPCSIGIAANRLVAKIATDAAKPDNILVVPPGEEAAFLAPRPVRVIPGCGKSTEEWLRGRGITLIRELQAFSPETLERHLGQMGTFLHDAAWGRGSTKFHREPKTRSFSREMTFDRDLSDRARLKSEIWEMVKDLGGTLRAEGIFARTVRLKLRYPPFETLTRSHVLEAPLQHDSALFDAAEKLFDRHWDEARPLRLIGIGFAAGDGTRQFGLFEEPGRLEKQEKLDHLKDQVREKFGEKALQTGRDF